MRVLWLCNVVLPELCDEFGFKKINTAGWLTGMWNEMKKIPQVELGICLPIIDVERLKDGTRDGYSYYSFHRIRDEMLLEELITRFCEIMDSYHPDVIHIWGTEYLHSLAMVCAAERNGILDNVIVNIQGILEKCALHYANDLPQKIIETPLEGRTIQDSIADFVYRSKFERLCLNKVKHVIGRTVWDKAVVLQINPNIKYYFCNEILRPVFYENVGRWDYEKCEKYTIFISQASYPIKGFHTFLKGLQIIKRNYPNVKVYVAGHGLIPEKDIYAKYVFQQIIEYDLDKNITFLGILSEEQMCDCLKKCNAFVSSSSIENSPNSVCEAALIGVPIVASNVGGVASLIKDKEDGFLYPCNEYYMMAHYVCELFKNTDNVCERISKSASNKMQRINNVHINSDRNYKIYKQIAKCINLK